MTTTESTQKVRQLLFAIFNEGMRIKAHSDVDDLLSALRELEPPGPFIELCEARVQLSRQNWPEASRILKDIESQRGDISLVSALRALSLLMLHDDEWRQCAARAVENGDRPSLCIIASFLRLHEYDQLESVDSAELATQIAEAVRT
jgi:type III secretion protein HrpB1